MGAARYSIRIEQGATWRTVLTLTDTDLTGYTARMQVRASTQATAVLLELTTEDGRITIDGPVGKITLVITDDDTTGLAWCTGVYDLEITSPGGETTRLLRGRATVSPEVTR